MPRNSCSWSLGKTDTFRLASKKIFNIWGTNLQNPSKAICKIYIPDDGKIFVQVDQAGAEALVVAYLCRHGKFRDLFLNGIKSHVFVGLHLFKEQFAAELGYSLDSYIQLGPKELKAEAKWKEIEAVIKASDNWPSARRYYYMAKQVCHSSNYGIQAPEFAINVLKNSEGQIRLSLEQASKFLAAYHTLFPEIKEWHIEVQKQLSLTKTLRNLQGYPRKFYGAWGPDLFKKAYAFIPQSTVGTITNIAVTDMQYYIEDNNLPWDVLNNKHDSYLLQCPEKDKDECVKQAKLFMEQELLTPKGEKFRMRSEATVGTNWGELK